MSIEFLGPAQYVIDHSRDESF